MQFNCFKPKFHPLQANSNSRLVVDEDDFKWVTNENKHIIIIKTVP